MLTPGCRKTNASGSGQESPTGRPPMSLRSIAHHDIAEPYSREIDRWPDKEGEVFLRAKAKEQLPNLLKLRVLGLGLPKDRDVGVGVFPEGEEVLVGGAGLGGVAGKGVSAGKAEMGERT